MKSALILTQRMFVRRSKLSYYVLRKTKKKDIII